MKTVKHAAKITWVILLSIFFYSSGTLMSQQKNEAVQYLELFTGEMNKIQSEMWEYVKFTAHKQDASATMKKRISLIKLIENTLEKIDKIKPYNNDTILKNAVMKYLAMLDIILREDYARIVDMEQIAEQSYDNMEAYLLAKEKADQKFKETSKELQAKQGVFARANSITLIEEKTDISNNLQKAGEVMDYYNAIYLVFFKSFKQELYVLDALNRNDVGKFEQNRLKLSRYADEGANRLAQIKTYDKDDSIKKSCGAMLQFYKSEAAVKMQTLSDYYIQKDMFDKIKAAFDLKKEKTQEDVNLYNDKVKKLNDLSKKVQETHAALNDERNKLITEWNKTIAAFFDNHIPN